MKEPVRGEIAPKKISHIQFGLLSANQIERISEFQVYRSDLFTMPHRAPAPNSPLDPRLGVSDKTSSCATCKRKLTDCAGHFGHVKLALPVFHIGFFKHCQTLLACICKTCGRVLLPEAERRSFLRQMRSPSADALRKAGIFKRVVEKCKKASYCFECKAVNGKIKKIAGAATLKLVHERYSGRNGGVEHQALARAMKTALAHNREIANHLDKAQEDMSPLRVYQLFQKITDEDAVVLWLDPKHGRPEDLLLHNLLVPPVPIRPSVAMEVGGGSNEDDLTTQLVEILQINHSVRMLLAGGGQQQSIMEQWGFEQAQVSRFINGELPGSQQHYGEKKIRGLCQRLKGKSGRFRGNLSGKRVDFSGRTVISPDPNLAIDQVGVPLQVAKIMTYPERVSASNRERLKRLVLNGPSHHPGANIIRPSGDNAFTKSLSYADERQRRKMAEDLKLGDVVERHMVDEDVVLFNRQPSLHKLSIMAHRVKVMPWRTFRFNECVCAPYNADFDGDEMNMHLPQTEEARAEAATLMGVTSNLVTPRNGEPMVAATQDFITGAYLLTQKDVFLTREAFCRLAAYLGDAAEHIDLPPPSIVRPHQLWTGKQVFSLLIKASHRVDCDVNLEMEERNYSKAEAMAYLCPQDGFVCIRRSELVSGNLCKKTLGGQKGGLYYVLLRDKGAEHAARCMNRLAKLCGRLIGGHRGFSIGIDDVMPSPVLLDLKRVLLEAGFSKCDEQIRLYETGKLPLKPGCNSLQSLESELNSVLGGIRRKCGEEALQKLPWHNAPRIMTECGSKGSDINISQMMAILGQQSVGGKRIENGFVNRTLPHFRPESLFPAARGFVPNSFFSGLTATEFFFHTMGGREGLVDTAVKTAETGYMARRLMKALEDLSLQYDDTVRNSEKTVIQFVYGDDGLDPAKMEDQSALLAFGAGDHSLGEHGEKGKGPPRRKKARAGADRPVNFPRLLLQTLATHKAPHERPLSPRQIQAFAQAAVESPPFQRLLPQGHKFLEEIEGFAADLAEALESLLVFLGAPKDDNLEDGYRGLLDFDVDAVRAKLTALTALERRNRDAVDTAEERRGMGTPALGQAWRETVQATVFNLARITESQFRVILEEALGRYNRACVEPGEAVGAVGAQSISEPATQMTLKTFHFAGVASMNVTLGVPRLKEIINASKEISTPIITAALVQDRSETAARVAKAAIERTTIGQVARHIKEVYAPHMVYVEILLDQEAITKLHLRVDAASVRMAILRGPHRASVLKALKERDVLYDPRHPDRLRVLPPELKEGRAGNAVPSERRIYFVIQALKVALPAVMVRGISTVNRAIVNKVEGEEDRYNLLIEGYGLADVMGTPGVDGRQAKSNHIIEVERVLGIEAARAVVGTEIENIMQAYGIRIDTRHRMLLSDVMTFKGEVLGITRFGVAKMRESVLMLASFEKTTDHLFDAAVHGRTDAIVGVSECIIMGIPIPLGTGLFKLLHDVPKPGIATRKGLLDERVE